MNLEYTDTIKPRISDINYGGHLGHVELINLLHEVRVKFLHQYSLKETDIDGHVLVVRNLNLTYKNQVFWNNNLEIKMRTRIDGAKIIFSYSVHNSTLGNQSAAAEVAMVLLNRERERPAKPEIFARMLNNDINNGTHKEHY